MPLPSLGKQRTLSAFFFLLPRHPPRRPARHRLAPPRPSTPLRPAPSPASARLAAPCSAPARHHLRRVGAPLAPTRPRRRRASPHNKVPGGYGGKVKSYFNKSAGRPASNASHGAGAEGKKGAGTGGEYGKKKHHGKNEPAAAADKRFKTAGHGGCQGRGHRRVHLRLQQRHHGREPPAGAIRGTY